MKILIDSEQLRETKSRDKVPLMCALCQGVFFKPKNEIQRVIKGNYHGSCDFCSRKCTMDSRKKREFVKCTECNASFEKTLGRITNNNFCSQHCHGVFYQKNKKTGFRQSKAELFLIQLISSEFPNLRIEESNRKFIGLELDILIPDIKTAIEINGIVHFLPIYGSDKLNRIQVNDQNKEKLIKEKSFQLISLDISKLKTEKEMNAFLLEYFHNNLKEVIKSKLEDTGVEPETFQSVLVFETS